MEEARQTLLDISEGANKVTSKFNTQPAGSPAPAAAASPAALNLRLAESSHCGTAVTSFETLSNETLSKNF